MFSVDKRDMRELKPVCSGLLSMVMFALVVSSLPLSKQFRNIAEASPALSGDVQLLIGVITAMLTAQIAFSFLMQRFDLDKVALCISGLVIGAASAAIAVLFAAFPAVSLLLCRLNCPETLYSPRFYAHASEKKSGLSFDIERLTSLAAITFICIVLFSEFCHQINLQGTGGALLWSFLGILVIAALYLRHAMGVRKGPSPSIKAGNAYFRCAWYIAWFHLALIIVFSYLPAVAAL